MPIVVKSWRRRTTISGLKTRKKGMASADDPNKSGRKPNWLPVAKRFSPPLRGLSPGQRQGHPGSFPALDGTRVVLGPKAAQINTVLKGKPGTAMAAFGGQLNDVEIAAVISYTRHAWSNAPARGRTRQFNRRT